MLLLFLILLVSTFGAKISFAQEGIFVVDPNADRGTSSAAYATSVGQTAQAAAVDGSANINASAAYLGGINSSYAPAPSLADTNAAILAKQQAEFESQQSSMRMWGTILPICTAGAGMLMKDNSSTAKNKESLTDIYNKAAEENDMPRTRGSAYPNAFDDKIEVGDAVFSIGCGNFIKTDGSYGPWGEIMAREIKKYPEVYRNKIPSDMAQLCPNFATFPDDKKEQFWVNTFAAMANSESSCNSNDVTAENRGLLQLDAGACGSSVNLLNAENNLICGAKQLAKEMSIRPTLTKSCSNCPGGTYWAVLRSDGTPLSPNGPGSNARAREVKGSLKTQKLISGFNGCK